MGLNEIRYLLVKMNVIVLSDCQTVQTALRSAAVAADMLLRGRSAMNVKATCSFSADRHVLSSAVIQEGSVG